MVKHIIVFNVRDGVTHDECLDMATIAHRELSRIPEVLQISFGVAVDDNPRYRYSFIMDFENKQAVQTYLEHPIHVAFADEHFRPMAPDRITTDYEIVD